MRARKVIGLRFMDLSSKNFLRLIRDFRTCL